MTIIEASGRKDGGAPSLPSNVVILQDRRPPPPETVLPGTAQDGERGPPDRYDGRVQPLRALRALRRLIADPEANDQVFEIMRALNGHSMARGYRRLIATRRGGAVAYGHPELAPRLADLARSPLPPGSVGEAYLAFMASEGLSAEALVDSSVRPRGFMIDIEHPYAWFGRRVRDTHDVWHVLTGYGREPLGELCLTAFSYAQTGALGWACITLGGAVALVGQPGGARGLLAIMEAWRLGRRARWLMAEDYDRLLIEPLDEARRRLGLGTARRYGALPAGLRRSFFSTRQAAGRPA